jgi:hypothetical protein
MIKRFHLQLPLRKKQMAPSISRAVVARQRPLHHVLNAGIICLPDRR